jgi:hypothetical protein
MVLTDMQALACGGLSVYTKFCTPSEGGFTDLSWTVLFYQHRGGLLRGREPAQLPLQQLAKLFTGERLGLRSGTNQTEAGAQEEACSEARGFHSAY